MALPVFRVTLARAVAGGVLICAGAVSDFGTARAQGVGSSPGSLSGLQGGAPSFSQEQLDNSVKTPRRPPAALPGAAPKQEAIAPPTRVPALLSPTEELFDAINRGDMPAVRDAISRGADVSATDELGLTPLDLSIDLNRNEISFLLLSMRSAGSTAIAGGQGGVQGQTAQVDKSGGGKSGGTPPTIQKAARPAHPARGVMHAADTEPAGGISGGQLSLPTLFAGNGGAPIPRAGFLGFDGR